jgi:hypothetical protein
MDDSVFWLTPISFLWSAVAVEQDESPDSVRPDHGSTGAYSSWPSWAAAGTAAADGNWSRGLEMLRMFSAVVQLGPYGQACVAKFLFMPAETRLQCQQPGRLIFAGSLVGLFDAFACRGEIELDNETQRVYKAPRWPFANVAGVSFGDTIIGSLFGYQPQWRAATDAELLRPDLLPTSGFVGTLEGLQTPLGMRTLVSNGRAVAFKPADVPTE